MIFRASFPVTREMESRGPANVVLRSPVRGNQRPPGFETMTWAPARKNVKRPIDRSVKLPQLIFTLARTYLRPIINHTGWEVGPASRL
ncbi:unnamed protein product [Caenorhabditis auriculariae]|uniref:Uncharacterized protein n=1 Tax=Caenorhabditis auriculariae TaxID=2777116 RepID=A0A8S1H0S2_9PELO|nr:unnamed protein product [Caenorhabditis auriculariae]